MDIKVSQWIHIMRSLDPITRPRGALDLNLAHFQPDTNVGRVHLRDPSPRSLPGPREDSHNFPYEILSIAQ